MKVFISYSRLDADLGEAVYNYLSTTGNEVFIDKEKIDGGADWDNVIKEHISNCDIFVVIVTASSRVREQVKKEVDVAKDKRKTIIPCIDKGVEREEVPWELNRYNQIEFEEGSELGRNLSKTIKRIEKTLYKEEKKVSPVAEKQNLRETETTQSLLERAKGLEEIGQYSKALKAYDEAIKINPNNFDAYYNKGLLHEKIGEFENARKALDIATDLKLKDPDIWYHYGKVLEKLERYNEALEAFTTDLRIDVKDIKSWTAKANILLKLERYDEALEAFNNVLKIDSKNIPALKNKGDILKQLTRYDESLKCYDDLLKIEPNNIEAKKNKELATKELNRQTFSSLIIEIKSQIQNKDYYNAIQLCNKAIEIDPDNFYPYFYKGNSLQELKSYEEAIKCYFQALEIDPKNTNALNKRKIAKEQLNTDQKINLDENYNKRQIFISYAHTDKEKAKRLFKDLKIYNIEAWLDENSLLPGQKWESTIREAIKTNHYFIILLSKNSVSEQSYVQKEFLKELPESAKYIIPLRLDDCEIPESLKKYHYIDLFPDWNNGFEKILLAMGISSKPKKLTDIHWENLLDAIDKKNCIPIIGSSILEFYNQIDNESFLTNDELAKEWAERYDYPFDAPYELPKVAQYVAINELGDEMLAKDNVSRRFRKMKPPNFSSDKFSKSPHAILAELNLPVYITTNYDFFMETALKSQDKVPISEWCKWNDELKNSFEGEPVQQEYQPTPNKPLVFHFHGNIDYPESLVLTERDHFDFVINTNREIEKDMLPLYLIRALPHSTLLFIGYSLDDTNFRSIFQGALSFMSTVRKRRNSIAVIETPIENNSVRQKIVTKYLEKYTNDMFKIVIYWGEPNEFLGELQTRWKQFKKRLRS